MRLRFVQYGGATVSDKPKFEPTFMITNFSGTIREIMVFEINRKSLVNDANDFWEAQRDVNKLRNKLQDAYQSAIQKSQFQKAKKGQGVPDIWMFGAVAYDLITEQGQRLDAVLKMSGNKLAELAAQQGEALKAKAAQDGDGVYLFEKKSREKD
jgi:hypothetical protein